MNYNNKTISTPAQREVSPIAKLYLNGKKVKEISKLFNTPENVVRTILKGENISLRFVNRRQKVAELVKLYDREYLVGLYRKNNFFLKPVANAINCHVATLRGIFSFYDIPVRIVKHANKESKIKHYQKWIQFKAQLLGLEFPNVINE